jgi:hypothetical protein
VAAAFPRIIIPKAELGSERKRIPLPAATARASHDRKEGL